MMEERFEEAFVKAVKEHSGIKKHIEEKIRQIMEPSVYLDEPPKGKLHKRSLQH